MDLFEAIGQRKSCRAYTGQAFGKEELDHIMKAIDSFEPLYPGLSLDYRFAAHTKGLFRVEAPHYLIISGRGREREDENAGFIGQQLVLWLDLHGIGSVWLGKTRDLAQNREGRDIITIAFGRPEGDIRRGASEFKRKPIADITNAPEDPRIRAVHLAPSGLNLQPWYFEKEGDKVLVYKQTLKPPLSLAYTKTGVDMGIALCHYAVASRHLGMPFVFERKIAKEKNKKGYRLLGVLN